MKTHCNTKKKELKYFKIKLQWGEGKVLCVCAHTCTGDEKRETGIQRDRLGFRKIIQKAFAHMFIFVIKLISVVKSSF